MTDHSMPAGARDTAPSASASSDLAIATHVAREMLAIYGATNYTDHAAVAQALGAVREALRILLRAVEQGAVHRSVDVHFPVIAAFLADPPRHMPRLAPEVLRLRMRMRAAHYNPDLPHQVQALETVADIWPGQLADVIAGRAPLDHRIPRRTLDRILSVAATGPMPRTAVTA
ncbi:hypothetical protein SALBM135S_00870 [Streptomyces alboniger]